ncbi:hypothetical protein N657DRAFT_658309 [Parathielavia appendiculata]|uniref:DUF6604 domain-containing protein n=1 Tax=Parathielavia appendiculata TaxID=2587402 RepID=A0AAN6TTV8_9PEZI|nr:hypothetical protein N657DRAFT_658309 [Parathielavia appendiculata]
MFRFVICPDLDSGSAPIRRTEAMSSTKDDVKPLHPRKVSGVATGTPDSISRRRTRPKLDSGLLTRCSAPFRQQRRLELGQAKFMSWLKQTAEKLTTRKNEPETQASNAPVVAPQQSRREKKKAAIDPCAGAASDKFVDWTQLEVSAHRIADNANPEDVPDSAINILHDVVNLRKKSFRFFTSAANHSKDEKLEQSNANHAQPVNVLERVLARLKILVKRGKTRERTDEPKDGSRVTTADLRNLFAYLEVETAPDAADDTPDRELETDLPPDDDAKAHQKAGRRKGGKKTVKPKKPQRRAERAVAKTSGGIPWIDKFRFGLPGEDDDEEDELDLYMMVHCFFEDFNTIRNHVAELWRDYWYDRPVPLVTLAVVTNAFKLFHQLGYDIAKELRPNSPSLARYDFMMSVLFYHYGIDHIDYDSYDQSDKKEADERIWEDEADWLALPSYFELEHVLMMIIQGKTPMLAPSQRKPTTKTFQSSATNQIVLESAHLKVLRHNRQESPVLPSECHLLSDFQAFLRRKDHDSALIFSLHLWVATAGKLKQALENHNRSKYCKDYDFKRIWLGRLWEAKHFMAENFMWEDKKARFRQHEPVCAGLLDLRARLVYSELYVDTCAEDCRFRRGLQPSQGSVAIIHNFAASTGDETVKEKRAEGMDSDKKSIPKIALRAQLSQIKHSERGVDRLRALMDPSESDAQDGHGNGDVTLVKRENGLTKTRKTELEKERKAKLSQFSPIDMLQMLDKTFRLFDESAFLLALVVGAFGDRMWDRLGPPPCCLQFLDCLPSVLGQDLASSGLGKADRDHPGSCRGLQELQPKKGRVRSVP